jgi:hypothetical protein
MTPFGLILPQHDRHLRQLIFWDKIASLMYLWLAVVEMNGRGRVRTAMACSLERYSKS